MPKTDKNRILYVLRYLMDNTDDDHTASLRDIANHLESIGIKAHVRTIEKDIGALIEAGFNIESYLSTQKRYFVANRTFELPELKVLIDAVQAACFISPVKTEQLTGKIASLASTSQANDLKQNLYRNPRKEETARLMISIDLLFTSINKGQMIRFQYADELGAQEYIVSPYMLTWRMDDYFLVGYCETTKQLSLYIVSKVCNLHILEEPSMPIPPDTELSEFVDSTLCTTKRD